MKFISNDLTEWADIIEAEIINDSSEWFWPKAETHQIFEQAYMKFVNGNLNPYYFNGTVANALLNKPEYNPKYAKTLEFCNYVRSLPNIMYNEGIFGRMCIWNLPAGCNLLPHTDSYRYHSMIIRNMFIISENTNNQLAVEINGIKVPCAKGTLFQFNPYEEIHSFINLSDSPFYFLGFDFWNNKKLLILKKYCDLNSIITDPKWHDVGDIKTSRYLSTH